MNLFINTAFSEIEIALFDNKQIYKYKKWKSHNESIEVIEEIAKLDMNKVKKVLVCKGPGRFMSLRAGAAYAQTLAYYKGIDMYPFTSFEYLKILTEKDKVTILLQQVALNEVFMNGKLYKLDDLTQKNKVKHWSGDVKTKELLPEEWKERSLPEVSISFLNKLLKNTKKSNTISIKYGKEPSIG